MNTIIVFNGRIYLHYINYYFIIHLQFQTLYYYIYYNRSRVNNFV